MLECVIFDLDGLMVDSEPLQFRAYRDAFAGFGFELTKERWCQWHALEASPRRWIESAGLALDPEDVRSRKKLLYDEMIENDLSLKPGAGILVEELAAGHRLCVASGSRRESIEGCLEKFSLRKHFEQLCSATEVERSKPFPDVYLRALDLLGVEAQACIALEDSPTGLQAAREAGLTCVVCPDRFLPKPEGAYSSASLVVDSLSEIDAARLTRILNDDAARARGEKS